MKVSRSKLSMIIRRKPWKISKMKPWKVPRMNSWRIIRTNSWRNSSRKSLRNSKDHCWENAVKTLGGIQKWSHAWVSIATPASIPEETPDETQGKNFKVFQQELLWEPQKVVLKESHQKNGRIVVETIENKTGATSGWIWKDTPRRISRISFSLNPERTSAGIPVETSERILERTRRLGESQKLVS